MPLIRSINHYELHTQLLACRILRKKCSKQIHHRDFWTKFLWIYEILLYCNNMIVLINIDSEGHVKCMHAIQTRKPTSLSIYVCMWEADGRFGTHKHMLNGSWSLSNRDSTVFPKYNIMQVRKRRTWIYLQNHETIWEFVSQGTEYKK